MNIRLNEMVKAEMENRKILRCAQNDSRCRDREGKEQFKMTDTLILFKPLADFGEALKKECPKNDCAIYRNIYERYCEVYADYKRIREAFADLSEGTVRTLEHAIRTSEKELYTMWFENYAVLKQRAALGMVGGGGGAQQPEAR